MPVRSGEQLAGHGLGLAVHRRAIDHLAAGSEQCGEHLLQPCDRGGIGVYVEAAVCSASDDRQLFAGRRNLFLMHGGHLTSSSAAPHAALWP